MAREGGVTCVSTGPGSSNVIGGTFCIIKTYGNRVDDMIVREKAAMKIAFGENPKNCYKEKGVYSRMSVAAKLREVLQKTIIYDKKLREAGCETSWNEDQPRQRGGAGGHQQNASLRCKTGSNAAGHPRGDTAESACARAGRYLHGNPHCKGVPSGVKARSRDGRRADRKGIGCGAFPVAVGPSFGHATKYELKNKGFETPAILADAGCAVSIITDSPVIEERYLPLCAGRAIYNGMREFDALRAITIQAARHIGAEDRVGSIEEGKDADFVLLKGTPFSVDARILYTIINGEIVYQFGE